MSEQETQEQVGVEETPKENPFKGRMREVLMGLDPREEQGISKTNQMIEAAKKDVQEAEDRIKATQTPTEGQKSKEGPVEPQEKASEKPEEKPQEKPQEESTDNQPPPKEESSDSEDFDLDDPAPKKDSVLKIDSAEIRKKPKAKTPEVSKEEMEKIQKEAKNGADPFEEKPKEESKEPDFSGYSKSERDILEILRYGENSGKAPKGSSEKLADYYRQRKETIQRLQDDNIDDEDYDYREDPKYRSWDRRNRPDVSPDEIAELKEERLIERAKQQAIEEMSGREKESQKKLKEIEDKLRQAEVKPEIDRQINLFRNEILQRAPEEVMEKLKSGTPFAQFQEDFPIEAEAITSALDKYEPLAVAWLNHISKSGSTEGMSEVRSIVRSFTDAYVKQPVEKQERNGKKFIEPWKMAKLSDEEKDGHWTWNAGDVLKILRNQARKSMKTSIESGKQRALKYKRYWDQPSPAKEVQTEQKPKEEEVPSGNTSVKSSPAPANTRKSGDGEGLRNKLGL